MDRLAEKYGLLVKLGELFRPLKHLGDYPEKYDEQERAETIAQYFAEYPKLISDFDVFSNGQPGYKYLIQYNEFRAALRGVQQDIVNGMDISTSVGKRYEDASNAIQAIPIPRSSTIYDAGTPFTTYCLLKSLCESDASTLIVWIDPYMDMTIFHRFLIGVQPSVRVILVTSEPKENAKPTEKNRWQQFLDISKLYSQERGQDKYQLIVHQSDLHDRWLVLDHKRFYSLGGSAKDAGNKYFTVARLDATPATIRAVQEHIERGREVFGPNTLKHLF